MRNVSRPILFIFGAPRCQFTRRDVTEKKGTRQSVGYGMLFVLDHRSVAGTVRGAREKERKLRTSSTERFRTRALC